MSEIPDAEFRAMFAEFLRDPVTARALAYRMMMEEAIASAELARPPQCPHGYYSPEINCPHCGRKVMET